MALREQPEVFEAEVSGHLCGPVFGNVTRAALS
jgi:hypothetical protein